MEYYIRALKNYAVFTGRATRAEYWYFALFNVIFAVIATVVGMYFNVPELGNIYTIAAFIPGLAIGFRRMHDVGKSGWFLFVPIYSFVLAVSEGDIGYNQYGPDPKEQNYLYSGVGRLP
jgi:uncharacterized membrane protein YhaH (DUF805 family)